MYVFMYACVCMYVFFELCEPDLLTFHFGIHSGFSQQFLVACVISVVLRQHKLHLIPITTH